MIVAVPAMAMEGVFSDIKQVFDDVNTIVTDVGSVKCAVFDAATRVHGSIPTNLVPGHPIAGSERHGVVAANPDLFVGHKVILTPKEQTVTVWDKIEYIISKDPLLPLSQAFFDEDGKKIRELTFHEPREFDGKLMPSILEMRPLNKEGHLTRIIYDDIKFNVPDITEVTFSLRNLKSRL